MRRNSYYFWLLFVAGKVQSCFVPLLIFPCPVPFLYRLQGRIKNLVAEAQRPVLLSFNFLIEGLFILRVSEEMPAP